MPQLVLLRLLRLNVLLRNVVLVANAVDLCDQALLFLLDLQVLKMFLHERRLLGRYLLLQLVDLVVHDLELALHLSDFVLRLDQILAVEVAIRSHGLVEILLLLELRLGLGNFLLVVKDHHLANLDLLHRLQTPLRHLRRLVNVAVAFLLQLVNQVALLHSLVLVSRYLLLEVLLLLLVDLDERRLLVRRTRRLHEILVQNVALPHEILNRLAVALTLSLQRVKIALEGVDFRLQLVLLALSLHLLLVEALDLLLECLAHLVDLASLVAQLSNFFLLHLEFSRLLLVLRRELGRRQDLILVLGLQLHRACVERVMILERLLRERLLFAQLMLEARNLLLVFGNLRLLSLDFVVLRFQKLPVVLHLALELFLLSLLAIALALFAGDKILQLRHLRLCRRLLALDRLHPIHQLGNVLPQLHDRRHLLVALLDQVLLKQQKLIDVVLLANGEAGALLNHLAEIGNLSFELRNGLLCTPLLLV
eukprot:Opistho-2@56554